MREIKFRGWDTLNKNMTKNIQDDYIIGEWVRDQRFVVMQYTGLENKQGVEIYEGDILENPNGIRCTVKYVNEHAAFLAYWKRNDVSGYDYMDGILIKQCKIIGNIYENPELLEESK